MSEIRSLRYRDEDGAGFDLQVQREWSSDKVWGPSYTTLINNGDNDENWCRSVFGNFHKFRPISTCTVYSGVVFE